MSGTPARRTRKKPKVVSLWPGLAPPVPVVQPAVVERIEQLLDMAKEGLIKGIAYAIVEPANAIGTGWLGDCDQHLMIAALRVLDDRIMSDYRKAE